MSLELLIGSICIAMAGGIVRGITGFGGSMVMTPALSLFFDPKQVVPTVLILETIAAIPMLRSALFHAERRIIGPICIAAFTTVPIGSYLLANLEIDTLRNWIAGTVLLFSLLLIIRIEYHGPRTLRASIFVGALSGVLLGGTGIGGPPIILYMLSGDGSISIARANMTLCVSAISIAGLIMMWLNGLMVVGSEISPLVLGPCFYAGIVLGMHCFQYLSDQIFRTVTLVFLIIISLIAFTR